jgi:hypothetical protein
MLEGCDDDESSVNNSRITIASQERRTCVCTHTVRRFFGDHTSFLPVVRAVQFACTLSMQVESAVRKTGVLRFLPFKQEMNSLSIIL